MIADIGRGTGYLARGLSLISSKGIKRYVLIPLSLNIFLFGALIWTGYSQFAPTVEWMMSFVPDWLSFLESILWLFITSLTAIIVFFIFTPVANIIAAPFNAIMAEKVEELLTGQDINSNVSLMTIIKDSIMSQIGKLIYILLWSLLLLLISFIPVINIISPFLWIIFGSWLLSLEYLDYPMGNHDLTFKQQKETLRKRRGLSLGFGGSLMILTSIPIINFIVMPVAVAGATAMWVDQLSSSISLTR
ncbi:MAG: sulfate transporter CysZ [Gammaproteobacteria bacterium]|nr:sulfate transporter CysZ [Gammaproteobacteria bacterium]